MIPPAHTQYFADWLEAYPYRQLRARHVCWCPTAIVHDATIRNGSRDLPCTLRISGQLHKTGCHGARTRLTRTLRGTKVSLTRCLVQLISITHAKRALKCSRRVPLERG